ncbi:MAG: hypothetical protein AAF633_20800, partial [Chloroflexota bacterium]
VIEPGQCEISAAGDATIIGGGSNLTLSFNHWTVEKPTISLFVFAVPDTVVESVNNGTQLCQIEAKFNSPLLGYKDIRGNVLSQGDQAPIRIEIIDKTSTPTPP